MANDWDSLPSAGRSARENQQQEYWRLANAAIKRGLITQAEAWGLAGLNPANGQRYSNHDKSWAWGSHLEKLKRAIRDAEMKTLQNDVNAMQVLGIRKHAALFVWTLLRDGARTRRDLLHAMTEKEVDTGLAELTALDLIETRGVMIMRKERNDAGSTEL